MAFKRLIALVPVKEGQVVMSYGYLRHKPAGSLGTVLRNLDRWGIDEIAVIDITRNRDNPDFSILEQIRNSSVRTPVAYGGGIRSVRHAVAAVAQGCDRVMIDRMMWQAPREINRIAKAIGQQAVIGVAPLIYGSNGFTVAPVHSIGGETLSDFLKRIEDLAISELLIIDREHEGVAGSSILGEKIPVSKTPHKLIWFGGLNSSQAATLLERPDTVGVAFGNPFFVNELAVNTYRKAISLKVGSQLLRKVQPHGR